MIQHSYDIPNQGGAAFRADLNNALKALANLSAGASAPATTYAYMPWFDTTTGLLKFRNGSNTAWVISGPAADSTQAALYVNNLVKLLIDSSGDATFSGLIRGAAGAAANPAISFSTDTNTGIYSIAADILGISAGGAEALRISTTAVSVKKALNTAKATDIASAGSIDIGAADGNYINVTGTTAITALGTADAGIVRKLNFTGILTFTHNATSLILPGAANITTAVGDTAEMVSLGGGNWKCLVYQRADGKALVGNFGITDGASVATTSGSSVTLTSSIPSTAKRVIFKFVDVSLSALATVSLILNGETTGYKGVTHTFFSTSLVRATHSTSFLLAGGGWDAASTINGVLILEKVSGNQWMLHGQLADNVNSYQIMATGSKTTSAALSSADIQTSTGSFDGGSVLPSWE